MYCADFTAIIDNKNFPNKILFARQKYDLYQESSVFRKVYVEKFYIENGQLKFKYYNFGQTTRHTGYYINLIQEYKKTKTYKLNNFASIRDFLKERNIDLK